MSVRARLLAAIVLALATSTAASAQLPTQRPQLIKVNDRVYCATGYALGNVIYIITDKSVVVVDTTESPISAQKTLDDFRKVSSLPVSYIIYTHFHGDHINGAKVFFSPGVKIIAQKRHAEEMAKYRMLLAYNRRLNAIQFGALLPPEERGIKLANIVDSHGQIPIGYIPPTITFDDKYTFEEGGIDFELYHTLGETYDHLMVWLPQLKVVCQGDLFYQSFPMLASPMKPDRPVAAWADSLDRIRALHPEYLVGSHGLPVIGNAEIDKTLTNYARAIRYVHDQTVKGMNEGLTLEQIRQRVYLPPDLAALPYLKPIYGRVEWSVAGIYKEYTGPYDFDPAHLNPLPKAELDRAILAAAGGAGPLVKQAQKALNDSNEELALELAEIVVRAEPANRQAHEVAYEALVLLGRAAANSVERNIYLTAARDHAQITPK